MRRFAQWSRSKMGNRVFSRAGGARVPGLNPLLSAGGRVEARPPRPLPPDRHPCNRGCGSGAVEEVLHLPEHLKPYSFRFGLERAERDAEQRGNLLVRAALYEA